MVTELNDVVDEDLNTDGYQLRLKYTYQLKTEINCRRVARIYSLTETTFNGIIE